MGDEIRIELIDDDLQPADLEQATLALRSDLLELDDVTRVSAASSGPAPPGARAVGAAEIGTLLVAAKPVLDVVVHVIGAVRAWLERDSAGTRPAALKITVDGRTLELRPTQEQQAAIVEHFLSGFGSAQPPPA
jgi:hypothetical protein